MFVRIRIAQDAQLSALLHKWEGWAASSFSVCAKEVSRQANIRRDERAPATSKNS